MEWRALVGRRGVVIAGDELAGAIDDPQQRIEIVDGGVSEIDIGCHRLACGKLDRGYREIRGGGDFIRRGEMLEARIVYAAEIAGSRRRLVPSERVGRIERMLKREFCR